MTYHSPERLLYAQIATTERSTTALPHPSRSYAKALLVPGWRLPYEARAAQKETGPWRPLSFCRASMMEPYRRAEERVLVALAERFGLELPVPEEVHRLDRRALRSEVDAWLPHAKDVVKGLRPLPADFSGAWAFARARKEYLAEARAMGIA